MATAAASASSSSPGSGSGCMPWATAYSLNRAKSRCCSRSRALSNSCARRFEDSLNLRLATRCRSSISGGGRPARGSTFCARGAPSASMRSETPFFFKFATYRSRRRASASSAAFRSASICAYVLLTARGAAIRDNHDGGAWSSSAGASEASPMAGASCTVLLSSVAPRGVGVRDGVGEAPPSCGAEIASTVLPPSSAASAFGVSFAAASGCVSPGSSSSESVNHAAAFDDLLDDESFGGSGTPLAVASLPSDTVAA
mmetsp:Transcript_20422/g.63486  ORF Transcript_20422/g.63486 Transcript_20422/m.63486 type:complete len:257 (-) Transcript_20422:645-1415(-)